MTKVWFTSDTHFGHKNIPFYARRKFCLDASELEQAESLWGSSQHVKWSPSWSSVSKMDDHLISSINDRVAENDILWHLGDFSFGRKKEYMQTAKKYLDRIRCRNVNLVRGNHDNPGIGSLFKSCHEVCEIRVLSKNIFLSHYGHAFWNRSHYGTWHLYGHAHGSAEKWLDENMPERFSVDVGVDNVFRLTGEYRPISFEELSDLFCKRKGFKADGR